MKRFWMIATIPMALVPLRLTAQNGPANTTVFISRYTVDIDYHNVFKWFGGSVLGMAPAQVAYQEIVRTDSGIEKGFHVELAEDKKNQWFIVDTDTGARSFIHFPRTNQKELGWDAASFVERVLFFLGCRDSCDSILMGSLHVDTSKILATFTVRDYIKIPAPENIKLRGTNTRYVDAFTRDGGSEAPYISGSVVIERINGHAIYPYISAYLFNENIRIKLYLQSFSATHP